MIGLVMWPSFRRQGNPTFSSGLHRSYYAAPMVHAALGMTAEVLGLYIVAVASINVLPAWLRFRNWKGWIRAVLVLRFGIALIVFGRKKLPERGKGIGESIRGFKAAMKSEEAKPTTAVSIAANNQGLIKEE